MYRVCAVGVLKGGHWSSILKQAQSVSRFFLRMASESTKEAESRSFCWHVGILLSWNTASCFTVIKGCAENLYAWILAVIFKYCFQFQLYCQVVLYSISRSHFAVNMFWLNKNILESTLVHFSTTLTSWAARFSHREQTLCTQADKQGSVIHFSHSSAFYWWTDF